MQDQLRALISRHCAWLTGQISDIAAALGALEAGSGAPRDVLRQAIELTHQISGTSGSMGFAEVSEAASDLEYHLLDVETRGLAIDASEIARILALFVALETVSSGLRAERSSLYDADLSGLMRARGED